MSNVHTQAAQAYAQSGSMAPSPRQIEANALLKAARALEGIKNDWQPGLDDALTDALTYNRKLWTIFAAEAANDESELPIDLRNNIANLSIFIFKRSMELQAIPEPGKIDPLIEINKNIAAGLMVNPGLDATNTQSTRQQPTPESA
jgi:flagellar biosynthesis activator protein FlaF